MNVDVLDKSVRHSLSKVQTHGEHHRANARWHARDILDGTTLEELAVGTFATDLC